MKVMILGILTAIAACPAIIGTTEAIRQGHRNNAKERHRGQKSNLIPSYPSNASQTAKINGRAVARRKNKLYHDPLIASHSFAGYFLPHPGHSWGWKGEGLVSTITDDPPQLNWIYVDKDTHELKYGTKLESNPHIEGFIAVQEKRDVWALYFDVEDDGLKRKGERKRMLEVELTWKEQRKEWEGRNEKDAG